MCKVGPGHLEGQSLQEPQQAGQTCAILQHSSSRATRVGMSTGDGFTKRKTRLITCIKNIFFSLVNNFILTNRMGKTKLYFLPIGQIFFVSTTKQKCSWWKSGFFFVLSIPPLSRRYPLSKQLNPLWRFDSSDWGEIVFLEHIKLNN